MALDEFVGQSPVSCGEKDVDRYGRTVAACMVRGEDIGLWLVKSGQAFAYRRSRHVGRTYSSTLGMAQRATRRHSIAWAAASPPPAPLQENLTTVD
ncbi:MAG: excalibur domain-containing protein [Methylocystaceae bacterium]|nr:MAG: excalibur domain-containing protein [Methylocystaceae bacterium]